MTIHRTSNETWAYDFRYLGKRHRQRFKSREKALVAEAQKRTELNMGFVHNERLTFREAAQLFFENHSKPNKRSWQDDQRKFKVLNEMFGNKRLVDFNPLDIQNMRTFLEQKGLKSGTIDHYHALAKTVFNMMNYWRKFNGYNPAKGVKLKREYDVHLRFLSKEEINQLEKHLPASIYPYFIGALFTGMRRGEICGLTWENVILPLRDIYIPNSKSGKARHIPMSSTLYDLLLKLKSNAKKETDFVFGTLSPYYISHKFVKVCKKLGIRNARWHDIRHTFASQLVMAEVNIYLVSKWLGHSSVKTTEKYYAHLSPDYRKEEIQKLNKLSIYTQKNEWTNFGQTFEDLTELQKSKFDSLSSVETIK